MNKYFFPAVTMFLSLLLWSSCTDTNYHDERDAFIGIYDVVETCATDTIISILEIVKTGGRRSTQVFIEGAPIFGLNHRMLGYVNGSRITLPTQAYVIRESPSLAYEFSGEGLLIGNELRIDYQVFRVEELPYGIDERDLGTCRLIMIKR